MPEKPRRYDALVIGAGQAGPSLAHRLTRDGLKTALVERKLVGGTCVNTGCIPTKTLVASARVAHMARRAGEFGVDIEGAIRVDMKRVKERKDEVVGESSRGLTEWLEGMSDLTLYRGHARFEDDHTVRVDGAELTAPRIFVNTGARARVPRLPGLDEVDYLTNSDMMEVDFVPRHLVIVGGGYVGLEFAQMYRRFGSRVTVVEMKDRLIQRDDEDIARRVAEILRDEGVELRLRAECVGVRPRSDGVAISVTCASGEPVIAGSHLLLAVGRRPNTDDLGLERTGIETDARGFIAVDDHLRTTAEGVWALGEVNGRGAFTHTSYNDYEIVAANLFDDDPRKVTDRIPCYGLYVDPPLGRVGMTEQQVRDRDVNALIGTMEMARVARARERSETQGFMKILVDARSERILGAAILGIGGDEVVHSILDVMYADAPYTVIQRAMHIHPTVTELVPTLLGNLRPLD